MGLGCLQAEKKEDSEAAPPVAAPPVEQAEPEATADPKADEKSGGRKSKVAEDADSNAAPRVKVTLGDLAESRPSNRPGKRGIRGGPGDDSQPAPLAATAIGSKMSEEDVRKVAEANADAIGSCYLSESGSEALRLDVRLTVGSTGQVLEASVEAEDASEAMKECVVKAVGKWEFPPPKGGGVVKLRYPFTLEPID